MRLLPTLLTFLLLAPAASAAPTAHGDFDGDGRGDLAVGAPLDSVAGQPDAGAVNVIYGSASGLTERGDQQFTKSSQSIPGTPQPRAQFGSALATGDFDADGHADLAIGAPGEDAGALEEAPGSGAVTVLYGSSSGLRARPGATGWSQNSVGVPDDAEADDAFGRALAAADFDGDGRSDLAIGAPGESVDGTQGAGSVHLLFGAGGGLDDDGVQVFTQNSPGIKGLAGRHHRLGDALAAGDLSGNGAAELAVGIPGGVVGGHDDAGAVLVLYGRSDGMTSIDDLWTQDARGIKGVAERGDQLGSALAIGDFDADGTGDLAMAAPLDSVGPARGAGAVHVLYGTATGLSEHGDQLWTQNTRGIKSRASVGERFGSALAAADLSRNGADELVVGVPGQRGNAGAVNVLYGTSGAGLHERADQLWSQDARGIKGRGERTDGFGEAVTTGDYDGDGAFDMAVGAPRDSVQGTNVAGAVNVLYGSGRGLRERRDQLWTQGSRGIKGAVGSDFFGDALG